MPEENGPLQVYYQIQEMNKTAYSRKTDFITVEDSLFFKVICNVGLNPLIGIFGIVTNIINMIVFHKQQFTTTVNISFFALALSDLLCLVTLEWTIVFLNPFWDADNLPFVPTEFQYLTPGGWWHVCFGRVTSWITVYITAERCLSVALPLKVKQIVTLKKTTAAMCFIFFMNLMTIFPEYCIAYLDWKFVPERNKTIFGVVYRSFRQGAEGLIYKLISVSGIMSFIAVIMLTSFLTIRLAQQSKWHSTAAATSAHSESRSTRDKKTMKLVVMIAAILIACYAPGTITTLVTLFEPEFTVIGTYTNSFFAIWSIAIVTSAINSSVNIFLYYAMSTKYRETFNQLFPSCTDSSQSK